MDKFDAKGCKASNVIEDVPCGKHAAEIDASKRRWRSNGADKEESNESKKLRLMHTQMRAEGRNEEMKLGMQKLSA